MYVIYDWNQFVEFKLLGFTGLLVKETRSPTTGFSKPKRSQSLKPKPYKLDILLMYEIW